VQPLVVPAGQQPLRHHQGGGRPPVPVPEDNRARAHAEQAVAEDTVRAPAQQRPASLCGRARPAQRRAAAALRSARRKSCAGAATAAKPPELTGCPRAATPTLCAAAPRGHGPFPFCHLSMGGPLLQRTAAVAGSGQRTALVSGSGLRRTRVPGARAARAPRAQRAPGAARTPVTRGGLRRCTSCSHGQHTDASAAAMLARALARSFALSWVPRAAVGSEEVYRVKVWYVCLLATPQLAGGLAQPRASASQRPRRTVCGARLLAELGFWVRAQLGGELSRGGPPCAHAVRRYKQDITNW